jgi:hypothetical protein
MDLAERFAELFAGRDDAYGLTYWDGRDDGWRVECVRTPVTVELFRQHLAGEQDIGIYPVRPDNSCRWGCVDIDVDDLPLAERLELALSHMGIDSWIEVSNSKGHHVWVFAESWVPASWMRRTLLVACEAIGYDPKEVNPKRETGDILGNFVRLPYPGSGKPGRRVMLVPIESYATADAFASHVTPTSTNLLQKWASKWIAPKKVTIGPSAPWRIIMLPRLIQLIIEEGPKFKEDRSAALWRIARLCAEEGLDPGRAMMVVREVDARHLQKYSERADAELRYTEMIEGAYS